MAACGTVKREELIQYLKERDFRGPYACGGHEFMIKGEVKLVLPNLYEGPISQDLLARIVPPA